MSVLALIPARSGSKGIPGKNFRRLGDSPINITALAVGCAVSAGCDVVAVSSDVQPNAPVWLQPHPWRPWIHRPAELAQDDTPMIAVVQHALEQLPGKPDDIIVLLQPTQPFRTPERVKEAIALLQTTPAAESVVSVVQLPVTHSPHFALEIDEINGELLEWNNCCECSDHNPLSPPTRRQDVVPTYRRDGTVYAFYRVTVEKRGSIYGHFSQPLILDPSETCELDTEDQWREVEARWKAMHG
jgi:CMP-N,N'-diacetyllegionaminic acid synthase